MRRMKTSLRASQPLIIGDVPDVEETTRSRNEVSLMLEQAKSRRDAWYSYWKNNKLTRQENAEALRNYTALRGVVKTLKWVLQHEEVEHPLD